MGDAAERKETAKALARAAAYVRHLLSTRMTLRRSPEVQFLFDQSVAAQDRVEQILQELKQEEADARSGRRRCSRRPRAHRHDGAPDAAEATE